jgi:hypothetical protein
MRQITALNGSLHLLEAYGSALKKKLKQSTGKGFALSIAGIADSLQNRKINACSLVWDHDLTLVDVLARAKVLLFTPDVALSFSQQ